MTFPSIEQSLGLELSPCWGWAPLRCQAGSTTRPYHISTRICLKDVQSREQEQDGHMGTLSSKSLSLQQWDIRLFAKRFHPNICPAALCPSYSCKLLTSKPPMAQCSIVCTCTVCSAISFCWLCTCQLPASWDAPQLCHHSTAAPLFTVSMPQAALQVWRTAAPQLCLFQAEEQGELCDPTHTYGGPSFLIVKQSSYSSVEEEWEKGAAPWERIAQAAVGSTTPWVLPAQRPAVSTALLHLLSIYPVQPALA